MDNHMAEKTMGYDMEIGMLCIQVGKKEFEARSTNVR